MSSTPFGEHLKREREMRGVSLEEIAAATRINTRYLEALEKAHWSDLPGGAFNRGFIRSVARFLGLDEEGLIAEYASEIKEKNDAAHPPAEIPRDWKPFLSALFLIVVLGLLVLGGIFGYKFYRARRAAHQQQAAGASSNAPVSAVPASGPPASGTPGSNSGSTASSTDGAESAPATAPADGGSH
jgi:cytoskeleton protein RodZ